MSHWTCTKDIIFLLKPPITTYEAGKPTGVENRKLIYSSILAGSYSINDFNTKIKEFFLKQRQDWEPPQIKDLELVIPKHYTFLADNTIFYLGIQDKNIEKIFFQDHCHCTVSKSTKLRTS